MVPAVSRREPCAPGRPVVHERIEQDRPREGGRRLELRHVDVLALAGARAVEEAGEDGDGPEVPAHVVEIGERPSRRRPVREAPPGR